MPNARSTEVDALGVINLIGSNLIDRYPPRSILKELLQNADDAGARNVVVGWTPGLGEAPAHQLLRGPALFVVNDGDFTAEDARAICQFGQNYKFGEKAVIGKFGLGLKSVFHLCEAFFYLSSTAPSQGDDDGQFNNLASPWANTEYHRGWNTVKNEDLNQLREFLRPVCSQLGSAWFALWLPLRRAEHCNGQRFSAREDGDNSTCPPELLDGLTERGITRSLPLLHSVNAIWAWQRWEPAGAGPLAKLNLPPDAGRSLFRDYVKHVEDAEKRGNSPECFNTRYDQNRRCTSGRYEVTGNGSTTTVAYALVQSWSSSLLPLRKKNDWPMSFVLTGGQQPDKAQPHGAVVLGRRLDRKEGRLDVAWAVFLPLETAVHDSSESEFQLTLHGCFFVDAGRRHALHTGDDVRGVWNRRLTSEGVLPLIVPAVESLASANEDPEVVRRLTRAVAAWMLKEGNRADVCGKQAWVYRWFPAAPRWERVENACSILEIPDFGADVTLPNVALPGLRGLAMEVALTPSASPRLTANDPEAWKDEVLARALEVTDPQPLFEASGSGLAYLLKFLAQHPRLQTAAHAALLRTLRLMFAAIRTGSLDEHREAVTQLVGRIPAQFRRSLPLGGNWPEETRRNVCAIGSAVLFLPAGFEPAGEPGTASIPADHAISMVETLAGAMSPGRNTNPAAAVICAAVNPTEVIEATAKLRLWAAQRLFGEKTETVVCTLQELRVSRDRSTVLVGPANDWLRELAAGLAQDLTVVPPDTAAALFPTGGLPGGDLPGVVSLLTEGPQLGSIPARVPLLRRLLRQHPSDDLHERWCWAVRYLLHGTPDLPVGDDLYLASGSKGCWAALAQTALATLHQPNRILSDNDLSRLLNPDQRTILRIHALDPNGVAGLLHEVDSEALPIQFNPPDRDEVIRGLQQHPDLIRRLPLHDRVDGGMTRITENCYWEGSGAPGTLARHITLLRVCSDMVLAAIQRSAHPHELTPVEIVRLALRIGPGEHAEAVLGSFASYRTLAPEIRKQFTELRDQLTKAKWLPRQAGGRVAPADVLHDDKLGDAVIDALRVVPAAQDDPVPSADLSPEVREHAGFGELARQLLPSREQLVGRLAKVLTRDPRFRIGNVDLRTQDERDEWLAAFRDAPMNVMAARSLIARVDAVDPEVCVSRLLPPLRNGAIPADRLERILLFLRERHEQGRGARHVILRTHNLYLGLAAADPAAFKTLLPRMRLLNEAGSWADPASLCVAKGLDQAKTLDFEQQELLKDCVPAQPVLKDLQLVQTGDQTTDVRISDHHFAESVQRLRKYFDAWTASEEVAGWAGAFLALLGDYEPLQALANEFLGIASPGRTVWYVRSKAAMHDAHRLTVGSTRQETPSEMMGRQRLLVRLTDPSHAVEVTNLLGFRISVNARTDFENLLLGFGMDRIECPYLKGTVVRCLHLRMVKPSGLQRKTLRELVARTGELVLRVFFGQEESRIEFASVLEEFSGDDEFGVRVAQEAFLDARDNLSYLGLNASRNLQLRDLVRLADSITYRRSEESAIEAVDETRSLSGRSALSMEKEFRERLRTLIIDEPDVRKELVAAVERKVKQYQYLPRSVLFELFQNADDAYAEKGCTPDDSAVFVVQQVARNLTVFHNGRPINRSTGGDREAAGNHHDLRKMLSFGHSDKQNGPAHGHGTGKFGLGFKSVFLITDRPHIASGRLAFEVLGGVYPLPITDGRASALRTNAEKVGLPKEATVFDLPARDDTILEEVGGPFRRLAHFLVVFSRCIRAIRFGGESTSWEDREVITKDHVRIARGNLRPLPDAEGDLLQALVIRCGRTNGDVLFGLDESGFVPVSAAIPSIWVTTPTTDIHDVGYLINAPLEPDPGRSLVNLNTAGNIERLRCLSIAVGDAFVALYDAGTSALSASTHPDAVWRSFWAVLSKSRERQELHDRFMWGEFGVATRFYTERAALPTGLETLDYCNLTYLGSVQSALDGILDRYPAVFSLVAKWNSFHEQHPPGSVVSHKRVGKHLPKGPARIDLATVVGAELRISFVNPELAGRLGHVFTRDKLTQWREAGEGDEVLQIRKALETARFRDAAGKWVVPALLLTTAAAGDEAMRVAFAPDDRVLSEDYSGMAAQFFLTCRGAMQADADLLAEWVLGAWNNKKRRKAAIQYLGRGELGTQVKRKLHDERLIEGTWLEDLTKEEMEEAGLNEYEQGVLNAGLGRQLSSEADQEVATGPIDAALLLRKIADWWNRERVRLLTRFDASVYPTGKLPRVNVDGPGTDVGSRAEWLTLFITGILSTIGRTQSEANRGFLQLCNERGWLALLTDAGNGSQKWLRAVENYIDGRTDTIPWNHWLRQFVGIATVGRHLDCYAACFLAMNQVTARFSLQDVLTPRTNRHLQGTGLDAPPLAPILGIGACVVTRELVRAAVIKNAAMHRFCYPPVQRLREFLSNKFGLREIVEADAPHELISAEIYKFIERNYPNDPTFGGAFDIPLLLLAEDENLVRNVLG